MKSLSFLLNGINTFGVSLSTFVEGLLNSADQPAFRTGLGLGTQAVYNQIPTYTPQTGATYTFVLSDGIASNGFVVASPSAAATYTIPLNSSVAFAVNETISISNISAFPVTIEGDTGVTFATAILPPGSITVLRQTATDTWRPMGGDSPWIYEAAAGSTLFSNTDYPFAHGLGRRPYEVQVVIRKKTSTENDIAANIEMLVASGGDASTNGGVGVFFDDTSIYIYVGSGGLPSVTPNNAVTDMTSNAYDVIVRAR